LKRLIKKHAEKLRFGLVGVTNTLIDFVILFSLVFVGLPAIASNFISTSVALMFSFFANKKYTFKDIEDTTHKHFALFIVITLVGLWVIQPIIIESVRILIDSTNINLNQKVVLFIGKVLASVASLTWNYLMYQRFVFKKKTS
jgi:putative flippase GtrA